MGKNKNAGKPRNYALECGVYRFGKGKMYHKKAIYKFNKKAAPVKVRRVLYLFNLRIIFLLLPCEIYKHFFFDVNFGEKIIQKFK